MKTQRNSKKGNGEAAPLLEPQLFMGVLTKPAESFSKLARHAKLEEGVKLFALAFALLGLIQGLRMGGGGNIIFVVIGAIIGGIIASLIVVGIPFLAAILVGAKGEFSMQYYLTSLFMFPILILGGIFRLVPNVGNFLVALANLYSAYLLTLVLMEVHKFSFLRALLVWLVPLVLIFLFLVNFMAALGGLVMAEFALAQ